MFALLADCAHVTIPEMSEKALRYYQSGMILWTLKQLWSLLLPCLFLFTGFSGRLAHFAQKKNWYVSLAIYLLLFIFLYELLSFPLDYYASYLRPKAFDLSTQSFASWFSRYCKAFLLTVIGALAFVWMFYLLIKKSPKRWWLYCSLTGIAISFFLVVIQPVWIDPLFNDFGPMKNKALEEQILQLASQAGIQESRVFEVNKSQETKLINAYVVGMGKTKRIVLWDTLLEKLTPDQVLFVMGHEMGHYILHHIWWEFLYMAALLTLTFYLVSKCANFLIHRFSHTFKFHELSNIASFPLLIFLFTALSLLFDPISNCVSRHFEKEADRFGIDITHKNQAAAEMFVVTAQENLTNPNPGIFFTLWRGSHPSIQERIKFVSSYCPDES